MKSRCFVISDIHGRARALKEVLLKSDFDFEEDRLITLGDICDGGRKTKECYDLLLTVPNRIDVIGNHDYPWFYDWITRGIELPIWTHQGGLATIESYDYDRKNVPRAHKEFIENSLPYFVDEKNNIYVHGGFNPKVPIEKQKLDFLTWDRTLIKYARTHVIKQYNHVFVGHTTTQLIDKTISHPITFNNLTLCDCGGGWMGRLAMVDADTLDYWVSDMQVPRYEPDEIWNGEY